MHFDWKAYFIFTKKEQKGILVLGCILSCSLVLHYLLPTNTVSNSTVQQKHVAAKSLFYFDPNVLDTNQGIRLGLTIKQMRILYNYRAKGGRFYKKEDLLKWYGLSKAQANQLMPWVRIQANNALRNQQYTRDQTQKIDINNPNFDAWKNRTGLPHYKIKRILAYQKWAGGFTSVQGLQKVYGLTAYDYEMIRPYLQYHPKVNARMAYQTMRFEDWMALGIFDEKTVWAILKRRKNQGGKLTWSEMVVLFDLTEEEALVLKKRTNLSN
jgi:DNA uptake protein ComE-like DNA-binding protein